MGYKMPFTASEDEQLQQLRPATVDEEACPALDHGGISSFILQLTCISTLTAAKRHSSYVWGMWPAYTIRTRYEGKKLIFKEWSLANLFITKLCMKI